MSLLILLRFMGAMVRTKSIYDEGSKDDGIRILVTRYWPRGVKKERCSLWLRELGPVPELIRLWKSGALSWVRFKKEYLAEFKSDEKKAALGELKALCREANDRRVTLLCTCREEDRCHRSILKGLLDREKGA